MAYSEASSFSWDTSALTLFERTPPWGRFEHLFAILTPVSTPYAKSPESRYWGGGATCWPPRPGQIPGGGAVDPRNCMPRGADSTLPPTTASWPPTRLGDRCASPVRCPKPVTGYLPSKLGPLNPRNEWSAPARIFSISATRDQGKVSAELGRTTLGRQTQFAMLLNSCRTSGRNSISPSQSPKKARHRSRVTP